ncbi:MAG: YncE family protein [Bryobacteraceae bacterium]
MRRITAAQLIVVCGISCTALGLTAAEMGGYHVAKKVSIGGQGLWDYVKVDPDARRVYVSHATQVEVLDADTGDLVGTIPDLKGVHGIEVVPELNKGFITEGRAAAVTTFDLKSLKKLGSIPAGKKADGLTYEPVSRRIFVFNGTDQSATVIDAASGNVVKTIPLGGSPEFPVADGKGHVFVNLEDKNTFLCLNSEKLVVEKRWPVAPCDEPASMAINRQNGRLFIGCGNERMALADSESGRIITTLPIGPHVDATAFDPGTGLVFNSTYDGAITVFHEDDPDKVSPAGIIKTQHGSKTMGLDVKSHKLFVPAATFEPPLPANAIKTPPNSKIAAGTFSVLIFDPGNP